MADIELKTGKLSVNQLNLIMRHLPADLTFVDEKDIIVYFNDKKELLFSRNAKIIGTKVQDCHSQESISSVNKMIEEFKNGKQDEARSWIDKDGKSIFINYIAVRDEDSKFCGILEVTTDISEIKKLKGEQQDSIFIKHDKKEHF